MYHVNHAIKTDKMIKVVIASPDTDVLACSIYHYLAVAHLTRALPVHEVVDNVNTDIVDILPDVHALMGYDTSSKIGIKTRWG